MGRYSSYIEVEVDLDYYEDQIMEYIEPDSISEALDMMERWGYSDGDLISHILEHMDSDLFMQKVSDLLTVEDALTLAKQIYQYGDGIRQQRLTAKDNQIKELKQRVDDLLALNHTVITEKGEPAHETEDV